MSVTLIVDESVPVEIISYVSILTEKLHNSGIDVLAKILKQEFNCHITNLKNTRVPLEKRREVAINALLSSRALNNNESKAKNILQTYFAPKPKIIKNNDWLNKFNVGEEVLVYLNYILRKGRISKINKQSLTIDLYGYSVITDLDAMKNQTYGTNKLVWNDTIDKTIIRHNDNDIVQKGECEYLDKLFVEGERSVDYGN